MEYKSEVRLLENQRLTNAEVRVLLENQRLMNEEAEKERNIQSEVAFLRKMAAASGGHVSNYQPPPPVFKRINIPLIRHLYPTYSILQRPIQKQEKEESIWDDM
jgi:hypothetical protein